jgi:hypothetical protein
MERAHTEADFERLSWHDCHIWGIGFSVGDADDGDWTSDLVLEIDFITEWLCSVDGQYRFQVAPATLVFHGVTDPRIGIDWGDSGLQVALHGVSIDRISREQIQHQKVFLDRPYYRWAVELSWPAGGAITFGAVGFTQTLLAEPILCERQHLSRRERQRLTSRPPAPP